LDDVLGSPLYMAPEIVKRVKYDAKVDIWSLGVMTYILLSGKAPFTGRSKQEIFLQITSSTISYTDSVWLKISKEGRDFVRKMLTRDPAMRASAEELLGHPFITENVT
jgi:serine/threonine protein kinase